MAIDWGFALRIAGFGLLLVFSRERGDGQHERAVVAAGDVRDLAVVVLHSHHSKLGIEFFECALVGAHVPVVDDGGFCHGQDRREAIDLLGRD